ncbi:Copper amine oxidase domain-containing protein (modular protein) [[Clostridium] ultunense Esp]|nr:Copper amine oxidase domain-containing protein (modular protein) [[Clostridium] ultunense Esp]
MKKELSILIAFIFLFSVIPLAEGFFFGPDSIRAESESPFSDVNNHWARDTISWAVENKMAEGYADGTFRPNQPVTEAEFVALLVRAYHPEIVGDMNGYWAEGYYNTARMLNYPISGIDRKEVRDKPITRSKVAEILSSAEGVNFSGDDAVQYILAYGISKGNDPKKKSIESYKGNSPLTRAESLQFIYNLKEYGAFSDLRKRPVSPSDAAKLPGISNGDTPLAPSLLYVNGKEAKGYDPLYRGEILYLPVKPVVEGWETFLRGITNRNVPR